MSASPGPLLAVLAPAAIAGRVLAVLASELLEAELAARVHLLWAPCIALVVGASLGHLGADWTSDVLGGWMAGTAIASAWCLLYEYASARRFSVHPAGLADRPNEPS